MIPPVLAATENVRHLWSRAAQDFLWGQWVLVDSGFALARRVLDRAAELPPPPDPVPSRLVSRPAEDVAAQASGRVQAGFAPPREVYDVTRRQAIDWLTWPAWARPCDPELFEGTAREG